LRCQKQIKVKQQNNKKMKKLNYFTVLSLSFLLLGSITSCKKEGCTDKDAKNYDAKAKKDDGSCQYDEEEEPETVIKDVPEGDITTTVNWSKDTIYKINGFLRVQDGGVLNIEAGTVIFGDTESKGTLVVQKGGKIMAEGTASNPIIFTSEKAPGLRQPGDWGGVVICGKAKNNVPGGTAELEGGYGAFHGGTDDADNSGILKYVQINFAGIPINPNEEVNSLTMGSVGSGTVIENVLCAYGLDDAFEWFGGTVNCKKLVAYRGLDDDLDVDLGYSGNVQFALCIRGASLADQSGSNGFEVDNDGAGSGNTPFTSGTFSNITIIGPKKERTTAISLQFQNGAQLRRNCKLKIHNSFLTGYPNGFFIDGAGATANATAGDLVVKNTIIAGVENWGGNGYGSAGTVFVNETVGTETVDGVERGKQHPNNPRGEALKTNQDIFDVTAWFIASANNNTVFDKWQDVKIDGSIFDLGTPNVLPETGSVLLSGADFTGLGTFFESVSFRGAFGSTDWTEGWVDWNCAMTDYQ
jgi:hypothetical protein